MTQAQFVGAAIALEQVMRDEFVELWSVAHTGGDEGELPRAWRSFVASPVGFLCQRSRSSAPGDARLAELLWNLAESRASAGDNLAKDSHAIVRGWLNGKD